MDWDGGGVCICVGLRGAFVLERVVSSSSDITN